MICPELILYMIAAFSISGFPLFNGFISKSIIIAASGEAHHNLAMLLLLLASVGTFLSVGLKLPYFTWFAEDKGLTPSPPPKNMHVGMALVAFFCFFHGVVPSQLYRLLPYSLHFQPYSLPHLTETVQILIFTFAGFWIFREKLKPHAHLTLDVDWLYRRPAEAFRKLLVEAPSALFEQTDRSVKKVVSKLDLLSKNPYGLFSREARKEPYTPDRYRPQIRTLLSFLLVVFILLPSVLSYLLHGRHRGSVIPQEPASNG